MTILFMAPLVGAGTSGAPEVLDAMDDVIDSSDGQHLGDPVGDVDILSVWLATVDDESFSVTFRVRELAEPASSQYRSGKSMHQWEARFDAGPDRLKVVVYRDVEGESLALIDLLGVTDSGVPTSDDPANRLEFRADADEIFMTFPRHYVVNVAGSEYAVDFDDGDHAINLVAVSYEGQGDVNPPPPGTENQVGTGAGCNVCYEVDRTESGASFEFGPTAGESNAWVSIRPTKPTWTASPGKVTTVVLDAVNPQQTHLTATPLVTVGAPGWSVRDAPASLQLAPMSQQRFGVQVAVPSTARDGDAAVLTVAGGDVPIQVLLVVGAQAAAAVINALETVTPAEPESNAHTFFLFGQTQTNPWIRDATSERPVYPGSLRLDWPLEKSSTVVGRSFAQPAARAGVGVWQTAPMVALTTLDGPVSLEVPVTWRESQGVRVVALVGSQLPTDWSAAAPPPGVLRLESARSASASGSALFLAEGVADNLAIGPGARLEVAIFFERTGGAGDGLQFDVEALIQDAASPARLDATLSVARSTVAKAVQAEASQAIVGGAVQAPLGLSSAKLVALLDGPDGVTHQLSGAVTGQAVRVGSSAAAPVRSEFTGSFSAEQQGSEQVHRFEPAPGAVRVDLRLQGTPAQSVYNENQLWLEVRTADGQPVKASRTSDPQGTLSLFAADLARAGAGPLDAVVMDRFQSTPTNEYVLTIDVLGLTVLDDGEVSTAFVWPYGEHPHGSYRYRLQDLANGREVTLVDQAFLLTAQGPTLPPVALAEASTTIINAGTPMIFHDRSEDADGFIVSRHWDFGDGSTSTDRDATHTFATQGTYSVTLRVVDDFGAESLSAPIVVTVLAAGATLPQARDIDGVLRRGGTALYFANEYAAGTDHTQSYPRDWQMDELRGSLGFEYAAGPGRTPYFLGSLAAADSAVTIVFDEARVVTPVGAAVVVAPGHVSHSLAGASTTLRPPAAITASGMSVAVPGLAMREVAADDWSDGLYVSAATLQVSPTTTATTTVTLLQGALHSDVRTVALSDDRFEPLSMTTTTRLASASAGWLAFPEGTGVRNAPLAAMDGLRVEPAPDGSLWFALFSPDGTEVTGVVLSGRTSWVDVSVVSGGVDLNIRADGVGRVALAQYATAYRVADASSTRYAGLSELARQDREEVGLVVLGDQRGAGVGWAGADAHIMVEPTTGWAAWQDWSTGTTGAWTLAVDAPSRNAGKAVRIVMPAEPVHSGGLEVLVDGMAAPAASASADDETYVLTVVFDHFSLRTVQIRTIAPGVPQMLAWTAVAFGSVLAGSAGLFAGIQLRSRAATRALERAGIAPGSLDSGVGGEGRAPEAAAVPSQQFKSNLLRRLNQQPVSSPVRSMPAKRPSAGARVVPCQGCGRLVRFEAGASSVKCVWCDETNRAPPSDRTAP